MPSPWVFGAWILCTVGPEGDYADRMRLTRVSMKLTVELKDGT